MAMGQMAQESGSTAAQGAQPSAAQPAGRSAQPSAAGDVSQETARRQYLMGALNVMAASVLLDRQELAGRLGMTFGGDRDMYKVLGYPQDLTFDLYYGAYRRQDIAGRVVDLPAKDAWKKRPAIYDGKGKDRRQNTEFVEMLNTIAERIGLWSILTRVDRLTGIGEYGALLFGIRGHEDLTQPIDKGADVGGADALIYIKAFSQGTAGVAKWETNAGSVNFGFPAKYNLDLGDAGSVTADYSRMIHVVDDPLEHDAIGVPRLEGCFNRLLDLTKIVGGGAESTWLTQNRGMHVDLDPRFSFGPDAEDDLQDEIDEYMHGLRRFIRTKGVNIRELGGMVVDPSGLFSILLSLIAAAADIPQRILIGSERGELASSTDMLTWSGVIQARQLQTCEPSILRPTIDWMIDHKILPAPSAGEYSIDWPALYTLNDLEQSAIAKTKADIIAAIVGPMGDINQITSPAEIRTRLLGWPAEIDAGGPMVNRSQGAQGAGLPAANQDDRPDRVVLNPDNWADREILERLAMSRLPTETETDAAAQYTQADIDRIVDQLREDLPEIFAERQPAQGAE